MINVLLPLLSLAPLPQSVPPDTAFVMRAVAADSAPTIDGVVGDLEWRDAALATEFIQFEPRLGEPADLSTEALVLYDSAHVYVAFRVFDPGRPAAQLTRRDADLLQDDAVVLLLDTHHDRQSAYFFMTNLLGTQTDGRVANDGRTVDRVWDAAWEAAASPTEYGWSAEMSIPLTSIKYAAGDDRSWGINFGRTHRRTLAVSYWAGPLDNQFRVSQAGTLAGLRIAPPVDRLQAIVHGLLRLQEDSTLAAEAGVNVRYALSPGMSALATLNPDFATIEADVERVNLTRFEITVPEKRPFFLEGNELFRQRIRTFYSRRIPDITVGAQVLGKEGPWTIAGIVTRSEPVFDSTVATYGVGRLQRDLGSSNVALMVADRYLEGQQQGSLGMDATLFFSSTLGMTGQLAQTWGPGTTGTWAGFVRPSWDTSTSHFHVRYTHLGDHVAENVNAIGFIRDDDRNELDSALEHLFWFRGSAVERLTYDSNYNIYWSTEGSLRSWQIDQGLEAEFANRLNLGVNYREEFKQFEKDFRNQAIGTQIGYNTREFNSARLGLEFGRNFDSDFQLWTVGAAYNLTDQLSVEYDLQRLVLDPDPEIETTWIHVARLSQFFTPDLFLRLFYQTNSAIDRNNIQAVFVYRYKPPFGLVQLAYQRGTAEFGERSEQGNTVFLKATVVF